MVIDFNPFALAETVPWVACDHPDPIVVFSFYKTGKPKFREYCKACKNFTEDGYSGCGLKKATARYGYDPVMAAINQDECEIKPRRANYQQYMQSAEWFHKRQTVLLRSGGKCEICGNDARDVHHKNYKNLGAEHMNDLQAVCRDCHTKIHRRQF